MAKLTVFDSPYLLGFDQMEQVLDQVAKAGNDAYPPYNVEHVASGDGGLRITLAVAGFSSEELSVTQEAGLLIIRGRQRDEAKRTYLHRGIAARQFQRSFLLAEGMNVRSAYLENGLLSVDLERPEPVRTVRRIEIAGD